MKAVHFLLITSVALFWSCTNSDITNLGSSLQPTGDKIEVYADTFHMASENVFVEYMYVKPDTFLLGNFYDARYGSTSADILAQLDYPKDYTFRSDAVADSVALVLYYDNWFGDMYSPIELSVYEMNKGTFDQTTNYPTNLDLNAYCDKSLLLGKKTFTASDFTNSRYDTTQIVINLNADFLQRFSNVTADTYSSDENFLNHFKGIYITTSLGSSTMLYVNQLFVEMYYHYTYTTKDIYGNDSITTVNNSLKFPANSWFRQVNRIQHPDLVETKARLSSAAYQSYNFISSPANMNTKVILPLERIAKRINTNGKRLNFNGGTLRIDIEKSEITDGIEQSIVANALLIKESAVERFFTTNELPSDTCAILSSLSYEYNEDNDSTELYYIFDISSILSQQITKNESTQLFETSNQVENMVLIPVRIEYNSSSAIVGIKNQTLLGSTTLCGANHPTRPMRVNLLYSGF